MSKSLDIRTLSEDTGINVRTIRYYLSENLLPPPLGRGPAASYDAGHRDRLLLIRRLQDEHQPLAAIRDQLEALDDAGVAEILTRAAPNQPAPGPESAQDYVNRILGTGPKPTPATASSRDVSSTDKAAASRRDTPARSTWERITLHPDIELHVRRPLARADQRRLDALLEHARRLFTGKP